MALICVLRHLCPLVAVKFPYVQLEYLKGSAMYFCICICYTCTQVFYSYTEGTTWKILDLLTETLLI